MARPVRTAVTTQQLKAIALLVAKDVNKLTNEQIADKVGVTAKTLYLWKKEKPFNDELIKQAEEIHRAFLAETYTQLRSIISNPSVKDSTKLKGIELMLKNQSRLKDVQEQTVNVTDKTLDEMLSELEQL